MAMNQAAVGSTSAWKAADSAKGEDCGVRGDGEREPEVVVGDDEDMVCITKLDSLYMRIIIFLFSYRLTIY